MKTTRKKSKARGDGEREREREGGAYADEGATLLPLCELLSERHI